MKKYGLFYILVFYIFSTNIQAGILSSIAKAAKTAKSTKVGVTALKVLTVTESANLIFSKFKKDTRNIGLYIGEDSKGLVKIESSTGEKFLYHSEKTSLNNFILDIQKKVIKQNQAISSIDIYITTSLYFKNKKILDNDNFKIILINDNHTFNSKLIQTERGSIRGIELEENLFFNIKSMDEFHNVEWVLQKSYSAYNTKVISLFDELDLSIVKKISSVSGELHIPTKDVLQYGIEKIMKKQKGKTVFIISHIENNFLVIRHPDNSIIQKIAIEELNKLSKKNNISMILLGCKSSRKYGTSGYLDNVQVEKVTKNLEKALLSNNYLELFSVFSSSSTPLFLSYHTIDNMFFEIKLLKSKELKLSSESYFLSSLNVKTTTKEFEKEIKSRLIWFIPTYVHKYFGAYGFIYLVFILFGGISFFTSGWVKIKTLWIVPECMYAQYISCFFGHFFRIFLYLTFLPIIIIFFKPLRYIIQSIKNTRSLK